MINVLFIAVEFPPYQSPGVFRTLYFTKYMESFGIKPIVLTVDPDANIERFNKNYNPHLLKLLGSETVVIRTKLEDTSYSKNNLYRKIQQYFKVQDRIARFWEESLFKKLPEVMSKYNPKVVISSLPFFSQAGLAIKISKEYKLPLIFDLRDNWSKWCISPYASYFHYLSVLHNEKKAIENASSVITVTEELKQIYLETNKKIDSNKIKVIPNGYEDGLKFKKTIDFKGISDVNTQQKIIIAYVGSYYYNPQMHNDMAAPWYKKKGHKMLQYNPTKENWLYRSPYFFLRTLYKLFEINPCFKNVVQFHHYGNSPIWQDQMIKEFNMESVFVKKGFLQHQELQDNLLNVDLFLSTALKVEDGLDYAIASKTFDYIKSAKPILAFTPEGAQKEFIQASQTGIVFNPDDKTEQNARRLESLLINGVKLEVNLEYLKEYNRKKQAENFVGEILKVLSNKT